MPGTQDKKSPTKHLLFSLDFPPIVGGVSRFLQQRINNSDGIDLNVLTPYFPGWKEYDSKSNVNIFRYQTYFNNIPLVKRGFQLVQGLYQLRKRMAIKSFDVLESGTALPGSFLGWILKQSFKIKTITFVHGNDFLRPQRNVLSSWMLNKGLHSSDLLVVNSEFTADLLKSFGINQERIVIINPPTDLNRFIPNIPSEHIKIRHNLREKKILLTVSRLYHGRKGFDTVFKALNLLRKKHSNIHLIIIGSGPARKELEHKVRLEKIADFVTFAGYISDDELSAYYCACDIFIMVSNYDKVKGDVEGYGIVYDEAHACEKPCVAANIGGAPYAVIHGVDGLLIPPNDPNELALAVEKLLSDSDFARSLGKQGRRLLLKKTYCWYRLNTIYSRKEN